MKGLPELLQGLQSLGTNVLLQDQPYPVAAPRSPEHAVECVRAAQEHSFVVMALGTGSSFPPDFSLLRDRVLALLTVGLAETRMLSPFVMRASAGSAIETIIQCEVQADRKTLGGFIAGARNGFSDPLVRALWSRIQTVEVLTSDAVLRGFPGPARTGGDGGAAAGLLVGSRGRLGMITAVELKPPLPILVSGIADGNSRHPSFRSVGGDSVLGAGEIRAIVDRHGLFQW
ncbi:FAD-dependent oxidoreductase [bacterium]|nr:FAD-dependent oxidoreductase [bacterium]MBU1982874.1 FAD-dependent oxidoreductase [bacterium]